jgi:phospholipid transport system substrate-binding protein
MTIKNSIRFFFVSLLLLSFNLYASKPVDVVQTAANHVVSELKKHKANLKSNPKLVHQVVRQYIIPRVDTVGMSRSVLGRKAWYGASEGQKKAFEQQFVNLVIRTYSKALKNYDGEALRFYPLRGSAEGKRFVKVSSVIKRKNGKDIPLKYALVKKSGQWKVYDLSVEGVSLLQSFRSQFQRELKQGSLSQLINKLKQKS